MTDTLTHDQVNAAIIELRAWSLQPFTDEDAAAWRMALRSYRSGEFSKALDGWQRTERGRFRPTIGDLAQFLERPEVVSRYQKFEPDTDPWPTDPLPADYLEAKAKVRP